MNPVDDFLKTAGWLSAFKTGLSAGGAARTLGEAVMHGTGQALPAAMVGAALAGTAAGVAKGIGAINNRTRKVRDYDAMLKANPVLKKYDAGQVQMVYNSLRAHSPTMARDPLIANSFVRKTLEMAPDDGPYIDPQTAKTLAETQRNLTDARKGRGGIADAFKPMSMSPINTDPFDMSGKRQREDQFRAQMNQKERHHGDRS